MPPAIPHEQPWSRLPGELASALFADLDDLTAEIIREIGERIPEYARPMEGEFGRGVREGTERALRRFVRLIAGEVADEDDLEPYRAVGRNELRSGRSLDALQAAYRVGARVAWRRMSRTIEAQGAGTETQRLLAEALFLYVDELSALAVEGYAQVQAAAAGARERRRAELFAALISPAPPPAEQVRELARAAEWEPPEMVAALALPERDSATVTRRLGSRALAGAADEVACLLIADPAAPGTLGTIRAALRQVPAALGPTAPLRSAASTVRRAREVHLLIAGGRLPSGSPLLVDEAWSALLLCRDDDLVDRIAHRRLSALAELPAVARDRLTTTLLSWLRTRGHRATMAGELHIHPQTVRYRIMQLRELLGDQLDDPDARFEMELALRAATLRTERSKSR